MVRHWCSPTFRHSASCGAGQRCSCEPDDADGLAAAINRLAEDATLRRRLGGLARARAGSFTPDRQVDAGATGVCRGPRCTCASHGDGG